MKRGLLFFLFLFAVSWSFPLVQATYSIWTDRGTYSVGETMMVYISIDGGRVTLTFEGPYTLNINMGDLTKGDYSFPMRAETKDIGSWTVTLVVEPCGGFFCEIQGYNAANPPKAYFNVVQNPVPEFPAPALILALVVALVPLFMRSNISKRTLRR